jgi:nicotinamide mononucleotide transporter
MQIKKGVVHLRKFWNNLNKFEALWLSIFSAIIIIVTLYFGFTGTNYKSWESIILNWLISPLSALTGVICVVLCAKGDITNYAWGIVNAITYGYVAWKTGYYGDCILNWLFFLPSQFFIWYFWGRNLRTDKVNIVKMKRLTLSQIVNVTILSVILLIAFGYLLHYVDFWALNYLKRSASIYKQITQAFGLSLLGPMFDSSTEILQILAQVFLVKRFAEQWPMWIATNVITIIMWSAVLFVDPSQAPWVIPTLIMWVAYLINSVYGTVTWYKESRVKP